MVATYIHRPVGWKQSACKHKLEMERYAQLSIPLSSCGFNLNFGANKVVGLIMRSSDLTMLCF